MILLLGSSIIEKWKPKKLKPCLNLGYGRLTTDQLDEYFHALPDDIEPSIILFYCGANDLIRTELSTTSTIRNIKRFLKQLMAKYMNCAICVLSLIKSPKMYALGKIGEIERINEKLSKIQGTSYISVTDCLTQMDDFASDRHHLSRKGYLQLEKEVVRNIL
jgi:hypothetical protein